MLRSTALICGAILITVGPVQADFVIFSNVGNLVDGLDPQTLTATTYAVTGPAGGGGDSEWAVSFVVPHQFPATLQSLALVAGINHLDGVNRIDFRLLPDDGGQPGALPLADVRVDYTVTLPDPEFRELIFAHPDPLILHPDTRYWLALSAEDSGRFQWFGNGTAGDSPFASRSSPDGAWTSATGSHSPGFAVLIRSDAPEPGSIGLLLTGLAVLGAVRYGRRRP